jgi:uncharacterized membrane protein
MVQVLTNKKTMKHNYNLCKTVSCSQHATCFGTKETLPGFIYFYIVCIKPDRCFGPKHIVCRKQDIVLQKIIVVIGNVLTSYLQT